MDFVFGLNMLPVFNSVRAIGYGSQEDSYRGKPAIGYWLMRTKTVLQSVLTMV